MDRAADKRIKIKRDIFLTDLVKPSALEFVGTSGLFLFV